MWHKEHTHLRENVLSHTGYMIFFAGCPVTWASKLQAEVALSTMESEYIALSTVTRDLLPLRDKTSMPTVSSLSQKKLSPIPFQHQL